MDLSGLVTSAGINIVLCLVFFSLYSVLRKQPSNASVYFGQRLAQLRSFGGDHFSFDRYVPSPTWILKAWQASEEDIMAAGGMDAVIFLRLITFFIRIFSVAQICIALLPLNYFGTEMLRQHIPSLALDVFTIGNISEGSKWLWFHCLALYIISCSAWVFLYFEYENISKMRLEHIVGSSLNPRYFTILVRAIPSSPGESCSDSVKNFFTSYPVSSYLSHQMIYRSGTVKKQMNDASKMIECPSTEQFETYVKSGCFGGRNSNSFKVLSSESESVRSRNAITDPDLRDKECAAAWVFFRSRYAALVASQVVQSEIPMSWVTELAPEPHDVYWKNLSIPYEQLWVRRIAMLVASIGFMILFMFLVACVQGLLLIEQLEKSFSFLREVLQNKFVVSLITGYLPSVVLMVFMCAVPPTMTLFSTFEGPVSRSSRKKSAFSKVLYFLIWNVFFVNVLSANIIQQLNKVTSLGPLTQQLATAVPRQATFFLTFVLTSGWLSLASEIMQPSALVCQIFHEHILKKKYEPSKSFPYHTEIARVLLFGFLGFNYSLMAPLILPLLLVFFLLASLVYRNQILNVYVTRYQTGGQFWPMMHNCIIFSLLLAQVIAIGVFVLKRSSVAAALIVPLIIFTLLFNKYCRQMFYPVFKDDAAQVLNMMDRRDRQSGSMKVIHKQLPLAYSQFASGFLNPCNDEDVAEDLNPGLVQPTLVKAYSI